MILPPPVCPGVERETSHISMYIQSHISVIKVAETCPDANWAGTILCVFVPGCKFAENGSLTTLATQCSNQLPDSDCQQLFPCNSSDSPDCDPTAVSFGVDQNSYPYVHATVCTNPTLHKIAVKCNYLTVITGLYINLQVLNNVHYVVKLLNTTAVIIPALL